MKTRFTLLMIMFGTALFAQKNQLGIFIPIESPVKTVMPMMTTNCGFGASYSYRPFERIPMYLELKGNVGFYASQTLKQTYQFSNGSTTVTDVTYTSNFNKTLLGAKFILTNDFRPVRLFVSPQIGVAGMKTKIVIADPQDEDDCKALERVTKKGDAGLVYGGQIGLEISKHLLFKKSEEDRSRFYVSYSFLNSFKNFDYVNVRYMMDGDHSNMDMDASRDVNAKFINVSTNTIHEHKIAELYTTKLNMWGINVGWIVNF